MSDKLIDSDPRRLVAAAQCLQMAMSAVLSAYWNEVDKVTDAKRAAGVLGFIAQARYSIDQANKLMATVVEAHETRMVNSKQERSK